MKLDKINPFADLLRDPTAPLPKEQKGPGEIRVPFSRWPWFPDVSPNYTPPRLDSNDPFVNMAPGFEVQGPGIENVIETQPIDNDLSRVNFPPGFGRENNLPLDARTMAEEDAQWERNRQYQEMIGRRMWGER